MVKAAYQVRHNFYLQYGITIIMSQAFVKESEEQWLHDVAPTINALVVYLSRENNGVRVYEKKVTVNAKTGKEEHHMSNGLSYSKDEEGKWYIVW